MNILCILGSASGLESNSLMNVTVFNGLKENGYNLDLITLNKKESSEFDLKFDQYFDVVYTVRDLRKSPKWIATSFLKMIYLLWRNIIGDFIIRPYRKKDLKGILKKQYDLILAFCPPPTSALLARDVISINKLHNIRYIQYWSDPLTIGMWDDVNNIPLKRKLHNIAERNVLRDATEIVYCSKCLCEMQQDLYPRYATKMRWTDVGYIESENKLENKPREIIKPIRVGYFGAFQSFVRNIKPLLDAVKGIENIELVIRGDSDLIFEDIPENVDLVLGRVPYKDIVSMEKDCDVLICIGNIRGVQIPGKVFYYTGMNKPIIYIGDGSQNIRVKQYLEELNRYIICDNNKNSIIDALNKAIKDLPSFSLFVHERLKPKNAANRIVVLDEM